MAAKSLAIPPTISPAFFQITSGSVSALVILLLGVFFCIGVCIADLFVSTLGMVRGIE